MRAGRLDRFITIERYSVDSNSSGDVFDRTWTTLGQAWAEMKPQRGSEAEEMASETATQRVQWKIRYGDFVPTVKDRVSYDSKYYYLTNVSEVGREEAYIMDSEVKE